MATILCCSPRFIVVFLFVTSAIPLGFIISLERSKHSTHIYEYNSHGYMREGSKWDNVNRRFIVSYFEGGVGQILVPENHTPKTILEEETVVKDSDLAGNASLGVLIDRPRNRVLVVYADVTGTYAYGALAAYDLDSWKRVSLTQLAGPGDEKSMADDVAVDLEGNAYVTDAKSNKLWKVSVTGEITSVIKSPIFTHKEWYKDLVTLNGIIYHPDGFLLVVHTTSGKLFKIDIKTEEAKVVKLTGSLMFGDGIELLSPTKLIVAGMYPSGRLVESLDGWESASVVGKFSGPLHRNGCAAIVKDGRVYINHMFGWKKHAIVEAVFTPVNL